MPMLRRQPFVKQALPKDLDPQEELFYCKLTQEVFRCYDAFFERVILCNSLVWTCSLTGRPGLTFSEAIESEEKARASLKAIPVSLKRAMLYLATWSRRGRLSDLCDDVFAFVKDRFFVGEEVDAVVEGDRRTCKIVKVIPPVSSGKRKVANGGIPHDGHKTDDEDNESCNTGASAYQYMVVDCQDPERKTHVLTADDVMRKKGVYSKDKNRLFLKNSCEMRKSIWSAKPKFLKKYNIEELKLKDIFSGGRPYFASASSATSASEKKKGSASSAQSSSSRSRSRSRDGDGDRRKSEKRKRENGEAKSSSPSRKKSRKDNEKPEKRKDRGKDYNSKKRKEMKQEAALREAKRSLEERKKAKEELKLRLEEEKKRRKEEKEKSKLVIIGRKKIPAKTAKHLNRASEEEREKLREERRIMAACLREWQKPRDDLECDDLMDLPVAAAVDCGIPNECFGDALMVLELVHNFADLLKVKDSFPQGLTVELLTKAITERDVQGPLNDLLQLLLTAIFGYQEEEEDYQSSSDMSATDLGDDITAVNGTQEGKPVEGSSRSVKLGKIMKMSMAAANLPQQCHGTSLRKMTMDAFTLTEILRLHIMSSCVRTSFLDHSSSDNPAIPFIDEETVLLQNLATGPVFGLSADEKLKILRLLVNQLLSYISVRNEIEDRLEKLKIARLDLRQLQWAEQRREREEAALRIKKKMEERAKAEEGASGGAEVTSGESKENGEKGDSSANSAAANKKGKSIEEQKEEEEERAAALEAKRKGEFFRKERELAENVAKWQNRAVMQPLGRDRAYRRFWTFASLPGLFVEDDEAHVGSCLPHPTPYNPNSNPTMSFSMSVHLARYQQAQKNHSTSDKENEAKAGGGTGGESKSHKLLSDNHPTSAAINGGMAFDGTKLTTFSPKVKLVPLECTGEAEVPDQKTVGSTTIFGMCTSLGDACPVHGRGRLQPSPDKPTWAFFPTSTQVEALISALNPRGFREGSLKEILVAEKRRILQSVAQCPVAKLNHTVAFQQLKAQQQAPHQQNLLSVDGVAVPPEVRKSSRFQPAAGTYPPDTDTEDFMEITLRDSLLELEEKIYAGGLGSLKVKNRLDWREAILNRTYDTQCDVLKWAGGKQQRQGHKPILNGHVDEGPVKVSADLQNNKQASLVMEMASALLQIFQGIEVKYLTPPLAPEKEKDDSKVSNNRISERWEEHLMASTSLPQVFVHLATLEGSVAWSRSALNARCRLCRRKGDAEHMLLCDGCDRGHHMYCLKPPLKEIPEGDWLCPDCAPKAKTPPKTKKRSLKVMEEDDEDDEKEEDEEEEEEEMDDDEEEEVEVEVDVRVQEQKTTIKKKDVNSETHLVNGTSKEERLRSRGIPKRGLCHKCGKDTGSVIRCDRCPRFYHLECAEPMSGRTLRGKWTCPRCTPQQRLSQKASGATGTATSAPAVSAATNDPPAPGKRGRGRPPKNKSIANDVASPPKTKKMKLEAPRRSGRNMGHRVNYRKHSTDDSDDDWSSKKESKKSQLPVRRSLESISDEEYYGLTRRQVPPNRRGASDDVPLDYKTCDQLLTELTRQEDSWPFLRAVTKRELPTYYDVIKRPMDFGTMRSKLNAMVYQNNKEFVADVLLVLLNCCLFNPHDSQPYQAADRLGAFFSRRVEEVRLNLKSGGSRRSPVLDEESRRSKRKVVVPARYLPERKTVDEEDNEMEEEEETEEEELELKLHLEDHEDEEDVMEKGCPGREAVEGGSNGDLEKSPTPDELLGCPAQEAGSNLPRSDPNGWTTTVDKNGSDGGQGVAGEKSKGVCA